ncbi:FtsX-like permease family protein, partial [Streptococcus pneumoniae]|nr:FtsX-like permease family protein [Streptococcus pneumoniae]
TQNDNLRSTLFSLAGIMMGIVVIGSVALIYNAFAISVSERARHLGMLASVGATKRQKRNSVFFEGAIIGAISIPLGILAGLGGIWVTFQFVNTF